MRARVVRRQRRRVVAASLLAMGHQGCEALVPLAIGLAIDAAVRSGDVRLLVVSLAGLALLFAVLTTCYRWFARFGQGAVIDEAHLLRTELAARVLRPGAARRRHGELLSIASSDAEQSARAVIWVAGLCGAASALLVSSAILLRIDLVLGAGLIVTAAVVTLGLNAISPLLSRHIAGQQEALATASALATDLVTGLRVLHGLGAQRNAAARYRAVSLQAEEAGIRAGTAKSVQLGATVLAGTIVLAVSIAAAGLLALDGTISIGAFVAAVGAAQFIAEPLSAIGYYLQIGAGSGASAARVATVLDAPEAAADAGAGTGPPTADAILLDVPCGRLTGIVAEPATAGRIAAVLRGDLDPRAAGVAVRVDGAPPAGVHVEPHRPDLFAGSVADNLRLGRADGSLRPAIRAAGAAEFVDVQAAGVDEPVRDRGLSLSGGQRQRLALARALHADPPVLVLQEPTTAVDSVTEQAIAAGVRALRHGTGGGTAACPGDRTTIVLTSSPVLLAQADRVLHVDAGTVVAGTHRELLTGHDGYRRKVLG